MAGRLHLGTSGFAYKEWKGGVFYPEGTKDREMLAYYATRFSSVEINYTFRRQPSASTFETWRAQVPEGFSFTTKAHQRITHWLRLRDADEAVGRVLEGLTPLGDHVGAILFQCPPTLQFDRGLIESFTSYLPPTRRYAMEFRHPSWAEAKPILAEQGVAWCVAETDEGGSLADQPVPTAPFAYLRLRREDYDDESLKRWAARVGETLDAGTDVYCYFKHEDKAAGPRFAERLAELLGT